jgi:REP element-mobilizing transposase RayT
MTLYRRNLPHWHPEGASIFLTWRLYGSLPESPRSTARIGCATEPCSYKDSPGKIFKRLDVVLDRATKGPLWLKDPRIARCVAEAVHLGDDKLSFYALHAFVIMPNHVHLLITPKVSVPRLMNGLKGITAREANSILGRRGQHFWQDESFDHWVRTSAEFDRIRAYIEFNPVSARLVTEPNGWPWSSASQSILSLSPTISLPSKH